VYIPNILATPEPTILEAIYDCNISEATERVETLQNVNGCDSLIVTPILPGVSQERQETVLVCFQADVRDTERVVYTNSLGCDSVVVTNYVYDSTTPIDLTIAETCERDSVSSDTLRFIQLGNCDSAIVITRLQYMTDPPTFITQTTCDPTLNMVQDSLYFPDTNACDSLVIYRYRYQAILPTFGEAMFLCEQNVAPFDTLVLQSTEGCDSLIIRQQFSLPPIEETIRTIFVCDETQADTETERLQSVSGCDSLVTTNFVYEAPQQETIRTISCDEADVGTSTSIISNVSGCDSLVVTTITALGVSEPTILNLTTCNPTQDLQNTQRLTNQNGCDSLVITNYTLVAEGRATVLSAITTCIVPEQDFDTLFLRNQFDCDSLVIQPYVYEPLIPMYSEPVSSCDRADSGRIDTLVSITAEGCEQISYVPYAILPTYEPTYLAPISVCNEQAARLDTTFLLDQNQCDSLVVQHYLYEPLTPIYSEPVSSCDRADSGRIDTLVSITTEGCEQVSYVRYFILPTYEPTYLEPIIGCDPDYAGREDMITLQAQNGCDSIVIQTYLYEALQTIDTTVYVCELESIQRDTITRVTDAGCEQIIYQTKLPAVSNSIEFNDTVCSEAEQDIRTENLINQYGCDSTVIWDIRYTPVIERVEESTSCIAEPSSDTTYYQNSRGCDSLIVIREIRYEEILEQDLNIQICEGEGFEFGGKMLEEAGFYSNTFVSMEGCDSTVNLFLEKIGHQSIILKDDSLSFAASDSNSRTLNPYENDELPEDERWILQILEQPQYGQIDFTSDSLMEYRLATVFQDYIGWDSIRYQVCAMDCINNCDTASIYIDVSRECLEEINVPTGWGLTPEDPNGLNTSFDPLADISTDCAEHPSKGNAALLILNKWGEIVYRTEQLGEQNYEAWKGRDNYGNRLPDGVYYFALRFTLNGEEVKPIKGWVTLFSNH
ncbi:MAG: gliding motility-associated C-terminal domain-containing protein, partial [Bacteroidota bacterium]